MIISISFVVELIELIIYINDMKDHSVVRCHPLVYGHSVAAFGDGTRLAFRASDEPSQSPLVVVSAALHQQLRAESRQQLEQSSGGNVRVVVLGVRHANVLAQSSLHLPAVEVEESGPPIGRLVPSHVPRSDHNSFHHLRSTANAND